MDLAVSLYNYIEHMDMYIDDYLFDPIYCYPRNKCNILIGREMVITMHYHMQRIFKKLNFEFPLVCDKYFDIDEMLSMDPYYPMSSNRSASKIKLKENYFGFAVRVREGCSAIYEVIYNHRKMHEVICENEYPYDDLYASIYLHELYHVIDFDAPGFLNKTDNNSYANDLYRRLYDITGMEDQIQEMIHSKDRFSLVDADFVLDENEVAAEEFSILIRAYICKLCPEDYKMIIDDFNKIINKWL